MNLRTALLCGALLLSPTAAAWNAFGHMMIAAVAYDQLTPAAHAQVTRLLQLNPDYPRWVARARGAERDEIAFVVAATWADAIKSAPGYENDGERPAGAESARNLGAAGAESARNVGYADPLQHRYWHYIDLPFSPDQTPLVQPAVPNLMTQISLLRKTLATSSASDELKSYDLVWLLHLVGDAHQPLHATSRFTHAQPNGDAGGNQVALCELPCRNELHAFWDNLPGSGKSPRVAIRRANRLPEPYGPTAARDDEREWIRESYGLAQNAVYIAPIGPGSGPFSLDGPYRNNAHRIARDRLALAGTRLAHVLNEALH